MGNHEALGGGGGGGGPQNAGVLIVLVSFIIRCGWNYLSLINGAILDELQWFDKADKVPG